MTTYMLLHNQMRSSLIQLSLVSKLPVRSVNEAARSVTAETIRMSDLQPEPRQIVILQNNLPEFVLVR